MKLSAKAKIMGGDEPMVIRLRRPDHTDWCEGDAVLFDDENCAPSIPLTPRVIVVKKNTALDQSPDDRVWVELPAELDYLTDGDILRLSPHGQHVAVLYRRDSAHNSMLVTERCNSNCVMCSQPPKDRDDAYLIEDILRAIPLMDPATGELGLTGGEPTLNHHGFMRLVTAVRDHLPDTALHVLSNGRLFAYREYARRLSEIGHTDLMIGIPLYADVARVHDFVVQAKGAFDQTIRGMLNLRRYGVGIEIRVVLHRYTIPRLRELARFITRNLLFADHVALMGLEPMGYTKMNWDALWIDPADYQRELCDAAATLDRAGMTFSIYNHQLCVLDPWLHGFAVRSISDWKNIYLPECAECAVREQCGGLFASALSRHSLHIAPVSATGESVP